MKREKSIRLDLSGVLTDRERLWQAMRQLRTFDTRELALAAKVDRRRTVIKEYLVSLVRGGILRRVPQSGPGNFARYELIRDSGVEAPRLRKDGSPLPDAGQSRMWAAMKILRLFTARELAMTASLPEAPVRENTAHAYCRWLVRGHYLFVISDGSTGVRYRFMRDTGARAPQILSIKQLFDPNTGEVAAGETVGEAYEQADGRCGQ